MLSITVGVGCEVADGVLTLQGRSQLVMVA